MASTIRFDTWRAMSRSFVNQSLIQCVAVRSGPAAQTISSATPVAVTGLSSSFTPKFSNSIIEVKAVVVADAPHVSSFSIFKDGAATVSNSSYTNNNEANMQVTTYWGVDVTGWITPIPIIHYESAVNTVARTYAVYATAAWGGTARSMTINNRAGADMAAFSYMIIKEFAQ